MGLSGVLWAVSLGVQSSSGPPTSQDLEAGRASEGAQSSLKAADLELAGSSQADPSGLGSPCAQRGGFTAMAGHGSEPGQGPGQPEEKWGARAGWSHTQAGEGPPFVSPAQGHRDALHPIGLCR